MAFDTKAHLKTHPFDPVHAFHRPMAFRADNLLFDVSLVIEDHMLSQVIGFSPRRGCVGVKIPMLLLDLRVTGNNVFVAIKALFHRGQARVFRSPHIGMAKFTLDLFHTGMDSMAKGYGLLRAHICNRRNVEQV
jgi:hypothetical protein